MDLVQSIRAEYGIQLVHEQEIAATDYGLDLQQFYGERDSCEFADESCSFDGCLWACDDLGSPPFCTAHMFGIALDGYEFERAWL